MDDDFRISLSRHKGMLIIALASLFLAAYFFYPFMDGIILGTVFAYVSKPIRDRFRRKNRTGVLIAVLCIVFPILLVLGLGMIEIANQILLLARNQEAIRAALAAFTDQATRDLDPWVEELLAGGMENIARIFGPIAASIPVLHMGRAASLAIINFVISIPVCYFMLLEGEGLVRSMISLLPESDKHAFRRYIRRIDSILSGIFIGTIYTSILGSIIALLVFYAFDMPKPFALASLVFLAGMVPFFTSWAVIIPLSIYRYFIVGAEGAALFLFFSAALIYLPSELLIKPYLIASRSFLHPLLIMLSFLGGAIVAGIGGFFLAPAIMGTIVGIYQVRRDEIALAKP